MLRAGSAAKSLDMSVRTSPLLADNPIDLGPALPIYKGSMASYFQEILTAALDGKGVDCLAIACPWGIQDAPDDILGPLAGKVTKTMAFRVPAPSLSAAEEVARKSESLGFPTYPDCETTGKALAAAYRYSVIRAAFA